MSLSEEDKIATMIRHLRWDATCYVVSVSFILRRKTLVLGKLDIPNA